MPPKTVAIVGASGTGKVSLLYNPYQDAFLRALKLRLADGRRAFKRLSLFSGRRGGKTLVGALGTCAMAQRPDQTLWACAPSYPKLHDFVIPAIARVLPPSWLAKPYSAQHYEWTLTNRTIIQARSLDDVNQGRGPGLDLLWIDEGREVALAAYKTLVPAVADKGGVALLTTTPNGFDWCVASGSIIRTYDGDVPIESVPVGARVWTRQGWKEVLARTFMGDRPTMVVQAGSHRLVCTADHRIATPDGWAEAATLQPAARARRETDPAATLPIGADVGVLGVVGVSVRTGRAGEVRGDVGRASRVLAMRDRLQVVGPDAACRAAQMVDCTPGRNRGSAVGDPIGEPAGAWLAPDTPNPPGADQGVPGVRAGADTGARPDPTASGVLDGVAPEPAEGQLEPLEVSSLSHGVLRPVWDLTVKDCHEFVADGILVHNCWEKFWKPASDGVKGYWACKYRSLDNPKLDPEEVEDSRRELDPLFFQQEWEAEFVSFTGAIYGTAIVPQLLDTDDAIRTILPEWPAISPRRPCLVGLDPGTDHPFAGVVLVSTPAGLVVLHEYEQRDTSAMKHTQNLRSLLAQDNPSQPFEPVTWAIDRSQAQMAIELAQHGIYAAGAENDVMAGIQRVKSWLYGRRLWFIKPRCPKLIAAMFSYRYAENTDPHGAARREKVVKVGDDLPDALRYALMSWPELPYPDAPSPVRDLSTLPDEHRWALDRMQRADHPEAFPDETGGLDTPGMLADDTHDGAPLGDFWG